MPGYSLTTEIVFPDAPMVSVHHASWRHLLVSAGPEQAR